MHRGKPSGTARSVCLTACFLMSVGSVWSQETALRDPWQKTGLDFTFFNEHVTTDSCYDSELKFLSCISAVTRLMDNAPRDLHLVRVAGKSNSGSLMRVLETFDSIAVVEGRKQGHDLVAMLENFRARAKAFPAWRELFHATAKQRIDFDRLRDWLLSEVVDHERVAQYAAAAINGYISVEDAHARIAPAMPRPGGSRGSGPNYAANVEQPSYSGIGAGILPIGDAVVVTGLVKGAPAASAGLQLYDVILAVDGHSLGSKSAEEVVAALRGPRHTRVVVTVERQGQVRDLQVVRDQVEVKNVFSRVIEDRDQRWGYLAIDSFNAPKTCADTWRELRTLISAKLDGMILDLRNNKGGLIDQSVCVADLFLDPGLALIEIRGIDRGGRPKKFRTRYPKATGVPMVTLVNASTGSASEVVAGALQDNGRSILVGERTFGKGTVQTARPWDRSGLIMRFYTVARYYLPSGRGVQLRGIQPDLEVLEQPDLRPEDRIALREEDLFPTALAAEASQSAPSSPVGMTAWSECVTSQGMAGHRWSGDRRGGTSSDYPLYVAQDTLACMTGVPRQARQDASPPSGNDSGPG
jgi:C-terminal peptidase prc